MYISGQPGVDKKNLFISYYNTYWCEQTLSYFLDAP